MSRARGVLCAGEGGHWNRKTPEGGTPEGGTLYLRGPVSLCNVRRFVLCAASGGMQGAAEIEFVSPIQ